MFVSYNKITNNLQHSVFPQIHWRDIGGASTVGATKSLWQEHTYCRISFIIKDFLIRFYFKWVRHDPEIMNKFRNVASKYFTKSGV